MNYSKNEADRLLDRLEKHLDKTADFSESDLVALHEMAQAWRGWVSLGRGAKWVITVLGLVAAAVASYGVLAGVIKEWLRS